MLKKIRPDLMLNSLQEIPINFLKEKNILGIIIDLDNTLTNWNCLHLTDDVSDWLKMIEKQGFRFCIVSNNGPQRIEATLQNHKIPYISNAFKPSKTGFIKGMEILGTTSSSTVVIGDQLFTDVLGGKRLGLLTILVTPRSKKEFIGTRMVRMLEKRILSRF